MQMTLKLSDNLSISELQEQFTGMFAFLKIRLYKVGEGEERQQLRESKTLKEAGLKKQGKLHIDGDITVGEFEKKLREEYGLIAQVSRRSGRVWLETTMTDNWTLNHQNEHGRELSSH